MAAATKKHDAFAAYGVFVQACWSQHKRQYPDELIHKEIYLFNKQCSEWWFSLSEQERIKFQEIADKIRNTSEKNDRSKARPDQVQVGENDVTKEKTQSKS